MYGVQRALYSLEQRFVLHPASGILRTSESEKEKELRDAALDRSTSVRFDFFFFIDTYAY